MHGKLEGNFRGTLEVETVADQLRAVIIMKTEVAVASVVAAESPPGAPFEALKAQAVAARSYYLAAYARHEGFDFCDTTHCQFLREPPEPSSAASDATESTRNLMISYHGRPVAALYSAKCGGRTRALEQTGLRSGDYPYFAVDCAYCRSKLRAHGAGHGLGLCQRGAAAMAAAGTPFQQILLHYYPNTGLMSAE